MKSAREALLEAFEGAEQMARAEMQNKILIVVEQLFDRLVKDGFDVRGLHRYEPQEIKMKSPRIHSAGAGPRNRWGGVR